HNLRLCSSFGRPSPTYVVPRPSLIGKRSYHSNVPRHGVRGIGLCCLGTGQCVSGKHIVSWKSYIPIPERRFVRSAPAEAPKRLHNTSVLYSFIRNGAYFFISKPICV